MFNNINSKPNALRGHLNERPKKNDIDEKQENLILKNLVDQKANPEQEAKKNKNKENKKSNDVLFTVAQNDVKNQDSETPSPPKDFVRLLNII